MSLIEAVLKGHDKASQRDNVSSVLIKILSSTGKNFFDSIVPAILSFGNLHGPIEQTYKLLIKDKKELDNLINRALKNNKKIPGWGSGFVKGKEDQIWKECDDILKNNYGELYDKIQFISEKLKSKHIFPNAACYTASCCIVENIPVEVSTSLVIKGRIEGWINIYMKHYKKDNLIF